jgi:hypothetical protein
MTQRILVAHNPEEAVDGKTTGEGDGEKADGVQDVASGYHSTTS